MRAVRTPAARADALGGVFIGLASLQFGLVVVLGKLVSNSHLPIASFLAVRFGFAAVLLALMLMVSRQPLRAAPGEGWRLAVLGMVGYAMESGLFFAALKHGTAPAVTLLFFTYPVMVTIVAIVRGQGVPAGLVAVSLGAAVAGATLVAVAGGGVDIDATGALLAFGAAVMFTLYLTGADAVLHGTNSLTGAMWVSGSASISLAAFAVLTGTAALPHGSHQWAEVIGAGAFTAGAFVCLFAGLRRLGPVRTSIIAATEPLAATILAVLFLSTKLRLGTVGGGLLILAGAVVASVARKDVPAEPPVP